VKRHSAFRKETPTVPPAPSLVPHARSRVLFIIATLDRAGAEQQLVRLCVGLDRRRFQPAVSCLTRGGPLERELREARVPVWIAGKRSKYDLTVLARLTRVMRRFRPHLIHTWLFTGNAFGRTAAILAFGPRIRARERAARDTRGPHSLAGPLLIASERAVDIWKTPVHRAIDRFLSRFTARVAANCDAVRGFCVDALGIPRGKVAVVRNGIDLAGFDAAARRPPAAPLPTSHGLHVLGAVARLSQQKGIEYLLDAFDVLRRRVPDARLWIAGEGEDRRALEERAGRLGIAGHVHFLGHRPDVPALLRRLDLFVLPSLWEGLPNAIIEAMAARRPVVATAVDGTREVVVENETGLLVPPRSPGALASAMVQLLADPRLRRRMGRAGRQRVEAAFSERRMIEQTEALYDEVIGLRT